MEKGKRARNPIVGFFHLGIGLYSLKMSQTLQRTNPDNQLKEERKEKKIIKGKERIKKRKEKNEPRF